MLRISRPKTLVATAAVGAAVPFIMGVDAPVPSPANFEFWRIVAEFVAVGLIAAVTTTLALLGASLGAYLKARGKAQLEDGDPNNDASGKALLAAGEKLDPEKK